MNNQVYNECIEISKECYIYYECMTDGKFDINKFEYNIDWPVISWWQTVSEEFIREFNDKVNWCNISHHQKLSDEFIREFKDRFDWNGISRCQTLSEEFICGHLDKIDIGWLFENENITLTKEFKDKITILKMLIE